MREIRSSGSAEGVMSDHDPYSDIRILCRFSVYGEFYGNLAVTETGTLRSIYDNGAMLANVPDENAAEEEVHYALLEHPAPRNVLLIGGGVNGSIAQALKHPSIERIDYEIGRAHV